MLPLCTPSLLSSCKDGSWHLWDIEVRYDDAEDARLLHSHQIEGGKAEPVSCAAISPNGRTLVAAQGESLHFYDLETRQPVEDGVIPHAHEGGITGVEFAPDGAFLATSGAASKHIRLWDLPAGCKQ
eukprot:g2542.t1